jgi:nitrilase
MTRAAAIQMNSSSSVQANLSRAGRLIGRAADSGAVLVALPENFALMPRREDERLRVAEHADGGPIQDFLAGQAAANQVWLVGGTIPLLAGSGGKLRASCLVFGPDGQRLARYDKIHLFDVVVSDAESYTESDYFSAGDTGPDNQVCVNTPAGVVGLTICYDVRFPELYRRLSSLGATVFTVPSAFTAATGRAHWDVLLRARAIENLAYVIAPAQCGTHDSGRQTHGHSMVVDPWGTILDTRTEASEGIVFGEIEHHKQESTRRDFPSLDHRRL